MSYTDPNTVHNPATGTVAPAAWGDVVRDDLEFLIDPPACSVSNSSSQSIASGSSVVLNANTEAFDNDAMHSTVTNNSRVTAQTAGRYLLVSTVQFAANGTGRRGVNFLVNGTTNFSAAFAAPLAANAIIVPGIRLVTLAATDYVEARAFQDSGGALNVDLIEFAVTFLTR